MRTTLACALVVAGCLVALVGLIVLDSGAEGRLAAVVGPAVLAVVAGALLLPGDRRTPGPR